MEPLDRFWVSLKSLIPRRQQEGGDEDTEHERKPSGESATVGGEPESPLTEKMRKASRKWSWGGKILIRSATGDASGNLGSSPLEEA